MKVLRTKERVREKRLREDRLISVCLREYRYDELFKSLRRFHCFDRQLKLLN